MCIHITLLRTDKPLVCIDIAITGLVPALVSDTPGHWQGEQTAASQRQEENQEHLWVGVISHDCLGN